MASSPSNGRPGRRTARPLLAVALCGSLLAGCGGSSNASGPTVGEATTVPPTAPPPVALPVDQPQKPACALLTQAEVEAAIGAKVAAGKQDAQAARSVCGFTLAAAPDQSVIVVSTSSSGVPAAFDAARARSGSPVTVIAGDQAFVAGGQALVRRGNTMVAILVAVRQQPALLAAAATRLAQAVGTRL